MSALMWWLIPIGAVIAAVVITALFRTLRRPTEHHDLGKFASMQEAMSRQQNVSRRDSPRR